MLCITATSHEVRIREMLKNREFEPFNLGDDIRRKLISH